VGKWRAEATVKSQAKAGHLPTASAGPVETMSMNRTLQLMRLGAPGDDAFEHISQIFLRIDITEPGGVDERCQNRPCSAAVI
jgi:hypothetical protein